jgi:hypothetical protein
MAGDRCAPGWFKMEVSLGALITAVSILVGSAGWAYTVAGRAEQAGKDLIDMQARMQRGFDDLVKRLDGIDGKIAVLPAQQERVTLLLKAHDDAMQRMSALEARTGSLERLQVQTSTVLDGMRPTPTAVRIR